MPELAGLPYAALRFNKDGDPQGPGPIRPSGVSDLIVISHGWHQDPDDAEGMYQDMLTQLKAAGLPAGRSFGVTGIYWPSDQFKDDLSAETVATLGPAAATAGARDAGLAVLKAKAQEKAKLFGMDPDELERLVTYAVNGGPGDQDRLVATLRDKVGPAGHVDRELQDEHAELLDPKRKGRDIVTSLKGAGARGAAAAAAGGKQAQALGLSAGVAPALGLFGGAVSAVAMVLNQFAYFELKKRAGKVGAALGGLLDADGLKDVQRLHLVGHSFGARLVTAATSVMQTVRPYSLTMLQGAFSHNALGAQIKPGLDGAYRNVVADKKVSGRIVITHTWNDHAVGVLYAIASRASNDVAAGLVRVTDTFGGAKDIHGGMGANGAQRLGDGEGDDRAFDGQSVLKLAAGKAHSLKCEFIQSHTDIRTPGVARVMAAALS